MDRRIAPSVQIEAAIEAALLNGLAEPDRLSELGRLGARLGLQRAAEGEIAIAMPQVRDTLTRFVSSVIPDTRAIVRTRPLEALVIGAYVVADHRNLPRADHRNSPVLSTRSGPF